MDDLRDRMRSAADGVVLRGDGPADVRRRAQRRQRRRRTVTLVVVLLGMLTLAGIVMAALGGERCRGEECERFSSFPTGDRAACPTGVSPTGRADVGELVRLFQRTAETGRFPWSRVDPVTQARFGSEQRYLRLLDGRRFDDVAVAIEDLTTSSASREPEAVACGEAVASSVFRTQVIVRRSAGGEQRLNLLFVRKGIGPPLLWLTEPTPPIPVELGRCQLEDLRPSLRAIQAEDGVARFTLEVFAYGAPCRMRVPVEVFIQDAEGNRVASVVPAALGATLQGSSPDDRPRMLVELRNWCADAAGVRVKVVLQRWEERLGIPPEIGNSIRIPDPAPCDDPSAPPTLSADAPGAPVSPGPA